MVHSFTNSSNTFIEPISVLSGFNNISQTIWNSYKKFAISKLKEATLQLRGSLHYLKNLTPTQASKELNSLHSFISILNTLKSKIEFIDDDKFKDFKEAALDFFEVVELIYISLQDIADIHACYKLSTDVLAKDWDSPEDEHWDNY